MAKSNSTTEVIDAKDPQGPSEAKRHIAIDALDNIGMHLTKAYGIARVIEEHEDLAGYIRGALWSVHEHIDEARKLLGVNDEYMNPKGGRSE